MLPEKDSMKLRSRLQECGGWQYVLPRNGIKGLITYGHGDYLHNCMREPYAHMETHDPPTTSSDARIRILDESEHAFPESGGSSVAAGFVSEEGQLSSKTAVDAADKTESKSKLFSMAEPRLIADWRPTASILHRELTILRQTFTTLTWYVACAKLIKS